MKKSVVLLSFVAIGLLFTGLGGYNFLTDTRSTQNYEPVQMEVKDSQVEKVVSRADNDYDGFKERVVSYYPQITYEYTIDGETYRSENVFPGSSEKSVNQELAQDVVRNNSEGSIKVGYVNPNNPNESYLVKDTGLTETILFTAFGLMSGSIGIFAASRIEESN